ncbi:hypothetical protein FA13DRAFT_1723562, partial [Coprinellus micaceus]
MSVYSSDDDPIEHEEHAVQQTLAQMNLGPGISNEARDQQAVEKPSQCCPSGVTQSGQNADLLGRLSSIAALRRRKRKSKLKDDIEDEIDRLIPDGIGTAGNAPISLSSFYCYFTCPDLLNTLCPPDSFDPNNAAIRYASAENERLADTKELYMRCVKAIFHDFLRLQKDPFPQLMVTNIPSSSSRWLAPFGAIPVSRLHSAALAFRKKCTIFLHLLGYNSGTGKYDKWCPLIYEDNYYAQPFTANLGCTYTGVMGPMQWEAQRKIKKLRSTNALAGENLS